MADMPRLVKPMLASLRHEFPADEESYGWELKWDGLRAVAYVSGGAVRLVSRNEKEMAGSYPELAALARCVGAPVILDGEIVALHDERPDFGLLQSRMHVLRPDDTLVADVPVHYYVFDVLYQGQDVLTGRPYTERRARLEDLGLDSGPFRTPPWHRGGGDKVLAESITKGLEGVVGKPLSSAYHPGQRRDWIKIKNVKQQEVIICGWAPGEGRRANLIGSLLLGVYDGDRLRYVGHVGTGFTDAMLDDLAEQLRPLGRETSPFGTKIPSQAARDAHWTEPSLVGEVSFAEWTSDGILRQPSWRGLRIDKEPAEVHREDQAGGPA
ncbi:MAG TPA: non-homologous end-joining DNA ligase [Streptosporangiaceae bacterium]|nr:non-homologous end-joining DNA ligase [Streptosporangiaceae bacterium]